ncbi:MAG: sigma 54-interacting transcriptional regulator, partial [Candidatus Sumerlaeota bacterium]
MTPSSAKSNKWSEVEELQLLLEISEILDSSMDLRDVLEPVLKTIASNMSMMRGTITLLNRDSGAADIEAAYGLSKSQRERGTYQMGEGVTGKVVQTGQPMVVPRISEDPDFLNRTGARKDLRKHDISFICVPIKNGPEVIGTLSADRPYTDEDSLDQNVRLLTIIASMLAQAARLRQMMRDQQRKLEEENKRLQSELRDRFRPANLIGSSAEMEAVLDLTDQVSKSNATVLIRGESGTGKELIAHAIHINSLRAKKPYVKVNCAALPEGVIESELFGHEKGAFTGAINARKGRFELADTGTIFLDEIGDLSLTTQV